MTRNPPRLEIQRLHDRVAAMSYAERLVEAERTAADPGELAATFGASVSAFGEYDNPEPFHPTRSWTPRPLQEDQVVRPSDVAWLVREQGRLTVDGAPRLDADYVDHEMSPTHSSGRTRFDDGRGWRSGVFADVLLASEGRTPVVCEVRIGVDKDPFEALLETLACIAYLATPPQMRRLRNYLRDGRFRGDDLRLDGYVLLHRFMEVQQDDVQVIDLHAERIAGALLDRPEVAPHVRTLACLEVERDGDRGIRATERWSHGGAPADADPDGPGAG